MDEQAVRQVAEAMVRQLASDMSNAERLPDIGLRLAGERGLTQEETAAALDLAVAQLKLIRLRVMHIADQRAAAGE